VNYQFYQHSTRNRRPDQLWLGELDVFKTLSHLIPKNPGEPLPAHEILKRWRDFMKWDSGEKTTLISKGVRNGLSVLRLALPSLINRVWLPVDVYPVYQTITPSNNTYEILSPAWLSFLNDTRDRDTILLPVPLHPDSRMLSSNEERILTDWLEQHPKNWLIIDAAYDYQGISFSHPRAIILRTLSKSWLARETFGVIEAHPEVAKHLQPNHLTDLELGLAHTALCQENLPKLQNRLFAHARRLTSKLLSEKNIELNPPATGYLTVVPEINNSDVITIPTSVFGSGKKASVVSCLGLVDP